MYLNILSYLILFATSAVLKVSWRRPMAAGNESNLLEYVFANLLKYSHLVSLMKIIILLLGFSDVSNGQSTDIWKAWVTTRNDTCL